MALYAISVQCTLYVIGYKTETLKNLHLKSIIKCFNNLSKNMQVTTNTILISPIDCSGRINGDPDCLFNGDIHVHVWHKFQNVCIPVCLLTLLNIMIQHRHHTM